MSVYSKLSSRTGLARAVRELINRIAGYEDSTGLIPTSFSYMQKQIDQLSATISGLADSVQGLQRLGLHDMTVTIVSPSSGATIQGNQLISGIWTDQSGHTAVSGYLYLSGSFITGLVFPASGYWNTTLDTTLFPNGNILVEAMVVCTAGTSRKSSGITYQLQNQIARGGTSQAGEAKAYGDMVSLSLSNPGVAAGSFVMTGSFYSSQGHALSSVSATSNTSAVTVSASFTGWGITVNCYADWSGGQQYAIITVSCVDVGGCVAQASVKVYSPYWKVGA